MLAKSGQLVLQALVVAVVVALTGMLTAGCTKDEGKAAGAHSGGVSGTYEAKTADGSMVSIEFMKDNKARLGMTEAKKPTEFTDGSYMTEGDHITFQVPGGMPMVFVNKGDSLESNSLGEVLHFRKK